MAINYVNVNGARRGILQDEAGINIETITRQFLDPKEWLKNKSGGRRGFANNIDPSIKIKLKGEILFSNADAGTMQGLGLATFATAITLANTILAFGIAAGGGIWMEQAQVEEGRDAWAGLDLDAEYTPFCGAAQS